MDLILSIAILAVAGVAVLAFIPFLEMGSLFYKLARLLRQNPKLAAILIGIIILIFGVPYIASR